MQQSDWLEHNSNMAVEYSTVIMSMIPSKGKRESCPYHCVLGNTVPELEGGDVVGDDLAIGCLVAI